MTDPEDPVRTAGASVSQAVAVAATAAELLASRAAARAADRADTADRQSAALRAQARAEQATGRLRFDACGDPMPSATAVPVPPPPAAASSSPRGESGQVIDGHVVARAYPVPQTAQTTAAQTTAAQARTAATAAPPAAGARGAAELAPAAATPLRPPAVRR